MSAILGIYNPPTTAPEEIQIEIKEICIKGEPYFLGINVLDGSQVWIKPFLDFGGEKCCCESKTSYKETFTATIKGSETFTLNAVANNLDVVVSRGNTIQDIDYTHTINTDQLTVNNLLIGDIIIVRLYF